MHRHPASSTTAHSRENIRFKQIPPFYHDSIKYFTIKYA